MSLPADEEENPLRTTSRAMLQCRNVPHQYANRKFLRTHFSQFGHITRVFANEANGAATVSFASIDEATVAQSTGATLPNGQQMSLSFKAIVERKPGGMLTKFRTLTTPQSSHHGLPRLPKISSDPAIYISDDTPQSSRPTATITIDDDEPPKIPEVNSQLDLPPHIDDIRTTVSEEQMVANFEAARERIKFRMEQRKRGAVLQKPPAELTLQPEKQSRNVFSRDEEVARPFSTGGRSGLPSAGGEVKKPHNRLFGKAMLASMRGTDSALTSDQGSDDSQPPSEAPPPQPRNPFESILRPPARATPPPEPMNPVVKSIFGSLRQPTRSASPSEISGRRTPPGENPFNKLLPQKRVVADRSALAAQRGVRKKKSLPEGLRSRIALSGDAVRTASGGGGARDRADAISLARRELAGIQRQVAVMVHDRFLLLDKRDKIIRELLKAVDAPPLPLCQDMCPEKERYRREMEHMLSPYELVIGGGYVVDHQRAVKEYSRSAADQAVILPYETRSPTVLADTMTYLLSTLLPKMAEDSNEPLSDLYDFIWNRTRAIRKDLNQQNIVTGEAVCLLEKCTRFHAYCSERLIEVSLDIFDPKLNAENLTKCLQTLKELYSDLRHKGVPSENEAEFVCYRLLMNLHDARVITEVEALPSALRSHPNIRFGLMVFTAYQVVLKSYKDDDMVDSFDLLTGLLNFESANECAVYLGLHGLEVAPKKIVLNKRSFYVPESQPIALRLTKLMRVKLNVPIEELINDGPLYSFMTMVPHSSFDVHSNFVGDFEDLFDAVESHFVVDQEATKARRLAREAERVRVTAEAAQRKEQEDILRSVVLEVVESEAREEALLTCLEARRQLALIRVFTDDFVEDGLTSLVGEVASELLQEMESTVAGKTKNIFFSLLGDCVSAVAKGEWNSAAADLLAGHYVESGVALLVAEVADEILESARQLEADRRQHIGAISVGLQLRKKVAAFSRWRAAAKERLAERVRLHSFPAGPPEDSRLALQIYMESNGYSIEDSLDYRAMAEASLRARQQRWEPISLARISPTRDSSVALKLTVFAASPLSEFARVFIALVRLESAARGDRDGVLQLFTSRRRNFCICLVLSTDTADRATRVTQGSDVFLVLDGGSRAPVSLPPRSSSTRVLYIQQAGALPCGDKEVEVLSLPSLPEELRALLLSLETDQASRQIVRPVLLEDVLAVTLKRFFFDKVDGDAGNRKQAGVSDMPVSHTAALFNASVTHFIALCTTIADGSRVCWPAPEFQPEVANWQDTLKLNYHIIEDLIVGNSDKNTCPNTPALLSLCRGRVASLSGRSCVLFGGGSISFTQLSVPSNFVDLAESSNPQLNFVTPPDWLSLSKEVCALLTSSRKLSSRASRTIETTEFPSLVTGKRRKSYEDEVGEEENISLRVTRLLEGVRRERKRLKTNEFEFADVFDLHFLFTDSGAI